VDKNKVIAVLKEMGVQVKDGKVNKKDIRKAVATLETEEQHPYFFVKSSKYDIHGRLHMTAAKRGTTKVVGYCELSHFPASIKIDELDDAIAEMQEIAKALKEKEKELASNEVSANKAQALKLIEKKPNEKREKYINRIVDGVVERLGDGSFVPMPANQKELNDELDGMVRQGYLGKRAKEDFWQGDTKIRKEIENKIYQKAKEKGLIK